MLNHQTQEFVSQNGEWTAMAIKLPDGTYTREPAPDHRLKRLLQVAGDALKKPISECRVGIHAGLWPLDSTFVWSWKQDFPPRLFTWMP